MDFWRDYCEDNLKFPTPLGRWVNPTHREWEWYYNNKSDTLMRKTGDSVISFVRKASTRGRVWTVGPETNEVKGLPASVVLREDGDVKLKGTGSKMVEPEIPIHKTVWDLLDSWGAHWMWEHVTEEDRNRDLSWVREGMLAATLVWCCDGSYKKKVAPTASGAEWVLYCKKTGNLLEGYFFEISDDASSYRGEQLGMCAVHHLIASLSLFFFIMKWRTRVCCDNEGTIKISRRRLVRIQSTMSCSDIF